MKPPTPEPSTPPDARERVLAAAERLFASRGVERTSTRDITAEAGVNVAAVNYYFRSKDGLAEEIFERLAARATAMRLAELSACMARADAGRKAELLEGLVNCFLRPYFEPLLTGRLFARFILEHRLQPSEMSLRVYQQHLDPFAIAFIDALCRLDPQLPRAEWSWRYSLGISAVILAVTGTTPAHRMAALSHGQASDGQADELKRRLAQFLCVALSGGSSLT